MRFWSAPLCLICLLTLTWVALGGNVPVQEVKSSADQLFEDGNYNDAQRKYRDVVLDPDVTGKQLEDSLLKIVNCLNRLGRIDEIDALLQQVLEKQPKRWEVLVAVAETYQRIPHYGFLVEGDFERGNRRRARGAERADASERDRVRSLQLLEEALPLIENANHEEQGQYYLDFANFIMANRSGNTTSWELQALTDLTELPDYGSNSVGWGYRRTSGTKGAPVDEDGNPVVYRVPDSWEAATNDGERWRWLLAQAEKANPQLANRIVWERATFAWQQFGVQTLGGNYRILLGGSGEDEVDQAKGRFQVRTLDENETIAELATGVKRFEFPDEYNPIQLLRSIVSSPETGYESQALQKLAEIFQNRMQFPKAAEMWQALVEKEPNNENARKQLNQIVKPWGSFEASEVTPAGDAVELPFLFRNGKQVTLEVFKLKHDLLLQDVKKYLKSQPKKWDHEKAQIGNIGYRIVIENPKRYLGERVKQWQEQLEPREAHLDRRVNLAIPVKKAGAYLVTAQLKDGNTTRIIVWLDDLSLVRKPLDDKLWYYAADTKTGEPVANVHFDFFGFDVNQQGRNRPPQISISEFADRSDEQGQLIVGERRLDNDYNWLITARSPDGRQTYLGFDRVWYPSYNRTDYRRSKVYAITDRPVYRPGQTVKFKFWARLADYQAEGKSVFAGRLFPVEIVNPRGEKVMETRFKADEFGGFDSEFELPEAAVLGNYSLRIPSQNFSIPLIRSVGGGTSFRVEEYKKPEFEVTVDAPSEPVALGEKLTATVKAKYYFGAPVVNGFVKYKVERTSYDSRWYPPQPWDWLYGNGYWWFGNDYDWYPGWSRWGCPRPVPPWWGDRADPPEVVMENEVPIGRDGTVEIEIDTALAKELHGDTDHKYTITAEVVDESRRTIVGSGSVLAARDPFQVFAWMDRGFYQVGDSATASIKAQTLDRKPIVGPALVKLFRITYDEEGKPEETEVQRWETRTDKNGEIQQKLTVNQPGQYRLSSTVTDSQGHEQEGAVVFIVRGEETDLADFRFNELEITPDKKTYQPGETVKLMINTNRDDSTVLLFLRPINGVYHPPKTIRLDGKSTVVDIGVTAEDMPNFFVEAMTLSDAEVHEQVRDIAVPPEKRIINVEVDPSSERYLPGEEAEVDLILTDQNGDPIQGSVAMTVYDRSVEYISGGSNVPEIREFFWKFHRSHHPQHQSSLQRYFGTIHKPQEEQMQSIGIFGYLVADTEGLKDGGFRGRGGFLGGGFGGGGGAPVMNRRAGAELMFEADAAKAAPEAAMGQAYAIAEESGDGELVEPTIRTEFADTAYWAANIQPDESGRATVRFPMPENLTEWKMKAWSMGAGTRVGEGEASVVTAKNVLVRLQAPRFFVEKDEVVISANVHNYLDEAKNARVQIDLGNDSLTLLDEATREIRIDADGEQRVDWRVKAKREGTAEITVKALTNEDSDAMRMTFPVYVHGMLKTESFTGVLRNEEGQGSVTVTVPEERRPEQTRLEIRYSPTLAGAMVDALPYLLDYPYGCTEQTLNRFLPAVITQNILQEMDVDLEAIREKTTNLNAQEIGDPQERAAQWERFDRNPVFDPVEMNEMVKVGLKRLADMQLSNGGWGWFSGRGEQAWPHTTATVVHGLQIAKQNGLLIPDGLLEDGIAWLKNYQDEQVRLLQRGEAEEPERPYRKQANNLDAFVYMVLVDAGINNKEMQDYLYRDRTKLSVYSLAMFGLSLHTLDVADRLEMVLQNIDQYYVEDLENETAYLKLPAGFGWWYWYGNEIEANAYYLKLLTRVEPNGKKAPRLVKYLLNNRKHSTYWNSTRDTALCIEVMAEYLQASGEANPDLQLEVLVDGEVKKSVEISSENLFTFDGTLLLEGEELSAGEHTIEFRKQGRGPLYWNAYLTNFTLEDPITAAGLELKVRRKVYKLVPREDAEANVASSTGGVVSQQVEKFDRVELQPGDAVESGDLLEIELGIDSKNDYEYIILEDFKAAGTEPVNVRSGYLPGANGAYVEFRDEKVAFFMRSLPRGTSSMSYRLRAEVPGTFSALPTVSYGMYAPELKANSNEFKLSIEEKERTEE